MTLMTLPISALLSPSLPTMALVVSATLTAVVATRAASLVLLGDLLDARSHFLRAGCHGGHVLTHLFGGGGSDIRLRRRFFGIGRHLLADGSQFLCGTGQNRGTLGDLPQQRPQGAPQFHLIGHVGRVLHNFEGSATLIEDGIVGPLDPDFPAVFAETLVLARLIDAAGQLGPEFLVLRAAPVGVVDEHAVMLAFHFLQRVSHGVQEILVGSQDRAIQLKLDDGLGLADRSHLPAIIGVLQLPRGHVGGILDDFDRAALSRR